MCGSSGWRWEQCDMKIIDILLILLLAAVLAGAVIFRLRQRKMGCGCCCEGCTADCGLRQKGKNPDGK